MADLGVFADAHTVCFERLLLGTPERVWRHLTEPELLSHWLGIALLEPRVGGRVELHVSDAIVSGTVLEHDPPQRFACSWRARTLREDLDGLVAFSLDALRNDTRLVLRHTAHHVRSAAASASHWHARLDALAARLANRAAPDQTASAAAVLAEYAARLPA
jgi:uncharacterized protein YndB with AHSA1/START domain